MMRLGCLSEGVGEVRSIALSGGTSADRRRRRGVGGNGRYRRGDLENCEEFFYVGEGHSTLVDERYATSCMRGGHEELCDDSIGIVGGFRGDESADVSA